MRTVPKHALPAPAGFWFHLGAWTIFLRSGLSKVEVRWNICHELAESHLKRTLRYEGDDLEACAELLTAALVAPRGPFQRRARSLGHDLPALAVRFTTTETAVALRLAETRCVEAAVVVRPGAVHVRTVDDFVLPPRHELRRLAKCGHPNMVRRELTDDPRRVALLAA